MGINYPSTEVYKRPIFPGLFQLPTLCGISLNPLDRSSFWTSPTMSFSIHLPGRSKGSLGLTISRPFTVINYSPNFFRTSSISELLQRQDFYSNQTPSKFLRRSTAFRISSELLRESDFSRTPTTSGLLRTSTTSGLLRISTVNKFFPNF